MPSTPANAMRISNPPNPAISTGLLSAVGMKPTRDTTIVFILPFPNGVPERRIVQRKMIVKRDLIPMQDDPENGGGLTGELRPNARTYAERRDIESRSDQPVFDTGRRHRVCRTEPRRKVRVCAADRKSVV